MFYLFGYILSRYYDLVYTKYMQSVINWKIVTLYYHIASVAIEGSHFNGVHFYSYCYMTQ